MAVFNFHDRYQIAFNYRVNEGKAPVFLIAQDNDIKNKDRVKSRVLEVPLMADGKWHQFVYTFSPNFGAKDATLTFYQIYQTNLEQNTDLEINNLKVEKIFTPQIFFTNEMPVKALAMPKITFQKINPTQYLVHIENATGPYLLNFGERYDIGWKAYPLSIIKAQNEQMQDKFIDKTFLTALFAKPLPEKNHFQTNGYANGWYVEKAGNYDLIISYWPQRLYYLGLAISLISLIAVLGGIFLWKK